MRKVCPVSALNCVSHILSLTIANMPPADSEPSESGHAQADKTEHVPDVACAKYAIERFSEMCKTVEMERKATLEERDARLSAELEIVSLRRHIKRQEEKIAQLEQQARTLHPKIRVSINRRFEILTIEPY